jgi:hypothetical protein
MDITDWAGVDLSGSRKLECRSLCLGSTTSGLTVRGSNPGRGEIFRTRPERPWKADILLYYGYRVFRAGKAAGTWR